VQPGDVLVLASSLKSGQYSKAERMKKMTPSALCKEKNAHYAFYLKLGEVGATKPEDMLEYINGCGADYKDNFKPWRKAFRHSKSC